MFRESLVSIYFDLNKLLILELSANKKKVKNYNSLDLPDGVIKSYKVQDKVMLSQVLKELWSKSGIRENSVGIIIPEFSTFTKLIQLPKLSVNELDEAIRWQAQEYLPTGYENMIMDWKIVEKDEKGFWVLVVAVEKSVLMNYVEAAELAGLFPLVVETPSLCLTRLSSGDDGGKLILYKGYPDTLLVASQKEKILGTSVIHSQDIKETVETSIKIVNHFEKAGIKKVLVGGTGVTENLIKELASRLNKEILPLRPEISGLTEEKIQEFLVPISMQLGRHEEPSDPSTLNLLPSGLVEKYKRAKLKVQVWSLTLTITLFVWISFLVVLGSYVVLTQQISDFRERSSSKSQILQQREKVQSEVERINEIAEKVLAIKGISVPPQKILNDIQKAKPQGITLNTYEMNLDKGDITVKGVSFDRESLIIFQKNLGGNQDITSVNIPISNFEAETNLEFELSFKYEPISSTLTETRKTQ